ncbi:MAG TPA: PIN domain-containing protein [Acidobacteriota bacterium]|nr:PIN domain-containing protein [Acidobacteriota bacterium]
MALILDTGPILALLDADDPAHASCVKLLDEIDEPLIVVAPALVEVDYWIRKRLQPEVWSIFVEDIATGAYRLEHLSPADLIRVAELQSDYADLGLGMVDAAVIAVCERLGEQKVATLDLRHFRAVRPKHCDFLHLLPDLG